MTWRERVKWPSEDEARLGILPVWAWKFRPGSLLVLEPATSEAKPVFVVALDPPNGWRTAIQANDWREVMRWPVRVLETGEEIVIENRAILKHATKEEVEEDKIVSPRTHAEMVLRAETTGSGVIKKRSVASFTKESYAAQDREILTLSGELVASAAKAAKKDLDSSRPKDAPWQCEHGHVMGDCPLECEP